MNLSGLGCKIIKKKLQKGRMVLGEDPGIKSRVLPGWVIGSFNEGVAWPLLLLLDKHWVELKFVCLFVCFIIRFFFSVGPRKEGTRLFLSDMTAKRKKKSDLFPQILLTICYELLVVNLLSSHSTH